MIRLNKLRRQRGLTFIDAPEGCQHGTRTNGTAYTRGTYSRVHTLVCMDGVQFTPACQTTRDHVNHTTNRRV